MVAFLLSSKKGQIALEYLVIVAFAFLLAAPIIFSAQTSTVDLTLAARSAMAKNALEAVKESAELVYTQGSPARVPFKITLPSGINSSVVEGRELSFTLDSRKGTIKVYEILDFNATGILPITPGTHVIVTKAEGNYVNITS